MSRSGLLTALVLAASAVHAATPLSQIPLGRGARLVGTQPGDQFGAALAGIGDVNGDGFADVAVAAPATARGATTAVGAVHVFFGRATVPAALSAAQLTGSNGFSVTGTLLPQGSGLGTEVAAAGDLNNDGLDDFVIGSTRNVAPLANLQSVWVVFGRAPAQPFPATLDVSALTGVSGFAILAETTTDQLGTVRTLAGGGDVNGDGFDDLLLGAPARSGGGRAYLLLGRASFTASVAVSTASLVLTSSASGAALGRALSLGGRINNDGLAELLVGNSQPASATGLAAVVYAQTLLPASLNVDALDGFNGFSVLGSQAGDLAGSAAAFVGDLNDDGPGDIALGAPGAGAGNGALYLFHGSFAGLEAQSSASNLNGSNGFRLTGSGAERLGSELARVGDRNGDGRDDLLLLAPLADPGGRADSGRVYLLHGAESPVPASAAVALIDSNPALGEVFDGVRAGAGVAMDIDGAGKFDGDARADLLIGVPLDSEAYLVLRSAASSDSILRNGFE